jgi:GLPGLI family protein
MKKYVCIYILLLIFIKINAQQVFISSGKIEFEKQVNLHKQFDNSWGDDGDNVWVQNVKKNLPKIRSTYYNLFFNPSKTLYKSGREAKQTLQQVPEWLADDATDNISYYDLENKKTLSQKTFFETTFLIEDSIDNINWRITNDTRTIAGIECRKAIGVIFDSVYVIAFYTDIITTSGGPVSFNGLPGMILGIAIPRVHTTWFATKVELETINESMLTAPTSGKKTNYKNLETVIKKSTKDWGKNSNKYIWKTRL